MNPYASSWMTDLKRQIDSAQATGHDLYPMTVEERKRYWPDGMAALQPDFLIGDFAITRLHNRETQDQSPRKVA